MDDVNTIKESINTWEEYRDKVKDKKSVAYLDLLNSMRHDYEELYKSDKDNKYEIADKCIDVCKEMEELITHGEYENGSDMLLASYDTRARMGDFEAYCIALEWNRPLEKQFYLPRKRILRKHGLIQALQDVSDDKLDFLFISTPPRVGKALSDDTPILTKNGWKKHGDLQVGDYVLNNKGLFVKVLNVSEEMPINCEMTFANGEKIKCHENHEWVVYDRYYSSTKMKTIETKKMVDKLRENSCSKPTKNHFRFSVPLIEPIQGEYKPLPIEPYSLGSYLGDGTTKSNCITIDKKDKIIAETMGKYYPISGLYIHKIHGTYRYYFSNLRKDLQKEYMCHSRKKHVKHIPDVYFTASLEQRLELLAGLLDTDGTLRKSEHRYSFSTINPVLRDDFVKLVSTFGWRCSIVKYEPRLSSSNIQSKHICWQIGFNPTFEIPCRLERKQLTEFSARRKTTIKNISYLEQPVKGKCIQVEGGIYLAGKTLIPTHNSTLGLFFLTFRAGLYPERSILGNGHSSSLAQSFYSEVLNVISSDEYRYNEIFPDDKVVNKNAEYNYVDLNKTKRFHTLMFKSIDGGTTGLAEASNILYCDDLIKDVEQANNPSRLEKLFYTYTSTIQDRVISRMCRDGVYRPCPEIHIATRWSLNDVIGRLISIYQDSKNERLRIINIPCYDENGESNFMYDFGKGFDKEYYHHLQLSEDPVIFAAKYLGEPIEREGLVFEKELLNYYTDLPNETPDRIVAYADVSHGGADYFSLPVAYVYGYEVYIEDVFFEHNFGGDDYSRPRVVEKVINHNVGRLGIEVANGGDFYASLISNDLKNKNYRCSVTTHKVPTTKSKLDRILACQNEIKGIANENKTYRLYFKDLNTNVSKEYKEAMNQLFSWNQNPSMQNKQHDDFPDSLAGLITNLLGGKVGRASSNLSLDKLGL